MNQYKIISFILKIKPVYVVDEEMGTFGYTGDRCQEMVPGLKILEPENPIIQEKYRTLYQDFESTVVPLLGGETFYSNKFKDELLKRVSKVCHEVETTTYLGGDDYREVPISKPIILSCIEMAKQIKRIELGIITGQLSKGQVKNMLNMLPTHHAGRDQVGGFCLINWRAILIDRLKDSGYTIGGCDFDVHGSLEKTSSIFDEENKSYYEHYNDFTSTVSDNKEGMYPHDFTVSSLDKNKDYKKLQRPTGSKYWVRKQETTRQIVFSAHFPADEMIQIMRQYETIRIQEMHRRGKQVIDLIHAGYDAGQFDKLGNQELLPEHYHQLADCQRVEHGNNAVIVVSNEGAYRDSVVDDDGDSSKFSQFILQCSTNYHEALAGKTEPRFKIGTFLEEYWPTDTQLRKWMAAHYEADHHDQPITSINSLKEGDWIRYKEEDEVWPGYIELQVKKRKKKTKTLVVHFGTDTGGEEKCNLKDLDIKLIRKCTPKNIDIETKKRKR